jgi:hypothetical protein
MMTPTHLVIGAAALARSGEPLRNALVVAGALLPDLSIYVLFAWSRGVLGVSEHEVWDVLYWQEPWQMLSALSNSFPLWGGALVLGLALRSPFLAAFAGAGLLHLMSDLPVHNADAHVHFWPFTDWRFHSPFSYWDRDHYGGIVSLVELLLMLVLIAVLWRRFRAIWVRALLGVAVVSFIAVPLYFRLMLGSH